MPNPYDPSAPVAQGGASSNPYLPQQAQALTNQVTNNLQTQILPGIDSGAAATGNYGGSRQGIAQGLAIGQSNLGLSSALGNMYGSAYANDQNNDTSRMGIGANYSLGLGSQALQHTAQDQNFALGAGGLGLGFTNSANNYALGLGSQALQGQNQMMNFYTAQRGQDQSGAQLGANLYNSGNAGYVGQGTGITGIGNAQQSAQWQPSQNASNIYSQYSGIGGGQVNTQNGSALGGALGGAIGGAQLAQNLGFGTRQPSMTTAAPVDQTGNGYGGSGFNQYGDGYGPV